MSLLNDKPDVALMQLAAAIREVRQGSDRAVKEDGEVLGYWQTPEFIEYLLELAGECERVANEYPVEVNSPEDIERKGEEILCWDGCDWSIDYVEHCPERGVDYMANGTDVEAYMPLPTNPKSKEACCD